ncbi:MAG: NUDIX hydrolase [Nitrososphaera sp.]|uniref:NUDIX hydrolase n=1 Tax=Nitrososphaera sp. TaxID=1971748 RepID=UPI003D6E86CE
MLDNAPEGWKLESSRQVYDSYYLKVFEDRLDLGGADKLYIRGMRRDYSTIVPFSDDGKKILTIKSYRHLVDSYQVEVPSGYVDEGETPRQAAVRELEEETGYVAKKMVRVGSYTLDYSMFVQTGHVFAAYGLEKKGRLQLGNMEKIARIEFTPVEKIKGMLLKGAILNAANIVALYRAMHYDKERKSRSGQ